MDAPLFPENVKFLLNQRERPSLSLHIFYEPRSWYIGIANQSGSAKGTVSSKIDENIEMLVFFY